MAVKQATNEPTPGSEEVVDVWLSEPQTDVINARTAIIADIAGQGAGKTVNIGLDVGHKILEFPMAKGFVGANTYEQLSNSTITAVVSTLEKVYGLTEFDRKDNPQGHFVIGKKPPTNSGWKKSKHKFKSYNNIMAFWNGAIVFLGSLENYKSHDGKEFAWAHLDETKDTKKEAITTVISGRLRQRGLWVNSKGDIMWNPDLGTNMAKKHGWKSWNPLYIHTSPAEGNVDWLVEYLGIAPYEKEIKEKITKETDYFYKIINGCTVVIYSSYHNREFLPPDYFETRKARLSMSEQLKFIYGYPFGKNGGEFFPGFDRFKHCRRVLFDSKLAIHTAWDFNVLPYVTCLLSQVEYVVRYWDAKEKVKYDKYAPGLEQMEVLQIRYFKEYCIPPPMNSTEQTADKLLEDFLEYTPEVYVYGDSSGRNRIEGLGSLTQYKIISNRLEQDIYLGEGWMRVNKANAARLQRRDLLNKIWEGKIPQVEIIIDEQCTQLIRDCEYVLQGKDGGKYKEKEKDKNGIEFEKMGHTSDAMEYQVCYLCDEFIKSFT